MTRTFSRLRAAATLICAASLAAACGDQPRAQPAAEEVENFVNALDANAAAEKEAAVANSRAREDQRLDAAEERIKHADE